MSALVQQAGLAGLFYPAEPEALAAGVDASIARAAPPPLSPKAVIAPHAGHMYSGDIAGAAYRLLAARRGEIKRVVLLGPNHRVPLRGIALSPADWWNTPFGPLPVDRPSRDGLALSRGVTIGAQPFAGEHSLEVQLPFIHRALGEVEILPVLVGEAPTEFVSSLLEQLWGGPETAIVVSSDLSHFHDYDTARAKDEETAAGIERLNQSVCEGDRACGTFSIAGLLDQAQRRDLRVSALDVRNSGDTQGGRDRVVGYGSFAFEYAHNARTDEKTRGMLIELARNVVKQAAMNGGKPPRINIQGGIPREMAAQRATFVTLKIGGELRGCRGSVAARQSLLADVAENAYQSGFGDPRFPPLNTDELARLNFHISILSTPRRVFCQSEEELLRELRPDVDGLVIRDAGRQGLFLPSVWEQIPDPRAFLAHLKQKAGMPVDYWSPNVEAYRFTAESFGEHERPN